MTAGIAASRPIAVASSASAMPGATTARLVDFARRNQITQIYITRPGRPSMLPALSRDPAQRIVDAAKDIQVVIVSERERVQQ